MSFGSRLRALRMERNMSIDDLDSKTGLARSYLQDLEEGTVTPPPIDTQRNLANALGVSIRELRGS